MKLKNPIGPDEFLKGESNRAIKDITEQVHVQKALRESHQRFLTVLDGIDAHIYAADMSGTATISICSIPIALS